MRASTRSSTTPGSAGSDVQLHTHSSGYDAARLGEVVLDPEAPGVAVRDGPPGSQQAPGDMVAGFGVVELGYDLVLLVSMPSGQPLLRPAGPGALSGCGVCALRP